MAHKEICRTFKFATKRAANKKAKSLRAIAKGFGSKARTTIKSKRQPSRTMYVVRSCTKRVA